MKKSLVGLFLFFVFVSGSLRAQGVAAIPMLGINPDPQSIALGWGGAANVSSSPSGYYYNPALLGYYAQTTNFSFQTYATTPNWINLSGWKLHNTTVTVGYNYKNLLKDLNVSLGLAYMNTKFDNGTFAVTGINGPDIIGIFQAYDKYDAYSFGVSFDYFVNLSFGMNFKKVHSELSDHPAAEESGSGKTDVTATDWGLLLNVPVLKLINDFRIDQGNLHLKPFIDFSFGASRTNIGNEVSYIDPLQKDPLPLTAHMGYNLSFGTDIKVLDTELQLFNVNLMVDAQDILIDRNPLGFTYQKGFGDISFSDNLLKWKATDKTVLRKGSSITFFETVTLLGGSFYGPGYPYGVHTNGIAVSSNGLFKLIAAYASNPYLKLAAEHLELKYVNGTTFVDQGFQTSLTALSISVKNFTF